MTKMNFGGSCWCCGVTVCRANAKKYIHQEEAITAWPEVPNPAEKAKLGESWASILRMGNPKKLTQLRA